MKGIALIALMAGMGTLSAARAGEAGKILEGSGLQGGLVLAIGCDRPALLAELRRNESFLVHGLHADPGKVAEARRYLQEKGLYGPIAMSRLEGGQLPFPGNLVNLIALLGEPGPVSREEMLRVLAPRGTLVDARQERLEITRKPWPGELDEWTHYLHDATNNAVSRDTMVAPPRGLQWTCGPEYARSHEHFGSVSAMVSAAGRVFYIIDEGPIRSVFLPPEWKLVARDAFSGVLLWKRPVTNWESRLRGFRSGPPEIGRRLIARGNRIYAALGYGEPVTVLDGATGKQLAVLEGTGGARELLHQDGVLYVLADDMTAADHDRRKKWINETAPTLKGYQFPKEAIPMYGKQRILALKGETGELLWKREFGAAGEILPATLAVADGRVCFQGVSRLVCLDARDGRDLWRSERPVARSRFSWSTPTLVLQDGVALTVDRAATASAGGEVPREGSRWILDNSHQTKKQDAELIAFSLKDGAELWRVPYFENYDTQLDIFVIRGVVWVGDLRHKRDPGFTEGRDLHTGKVTARIPRNQELYDLQMGHHRCYRNKATVRYLLLGRDGIEFVDPERGTGSGNWWVRGTCQYGIMPANGLVYAPQHSCACHPAEKLNGLNVLSARSGAPGESSGGPEPIQRGPAYPGSSNPGPEMSRGDWPMYRRDPGRSGFQDLPAPRNPGLAWTQELNAPLTAPVVAGGTVFIAETERHALHALSARNGNRRWSFFADGRIDSPPTVSGGLCLFGTRSGFVYCLRASDGEMVWRFCAAPRRRLIFSYEQLESAWPVHGSVLVCDGTAGQAPLVYFAAGRSSHLDGGIYLHGLELETGQVVHRARVSMTAGGEGAIQERVLPDILSLQQETIFLRDLGLDRELVMRKKMEPHLYAPGGFLDDTWWHRTYWIHGTRILSGYGGWPRIGNMVPAGRLLVRDGGELIYGYGRMTYRAGAGHVHPDAARDYKLFAEVLEPRPAPRKRAKGQKNEKTGTNRKGKKAQQRRREFRWSASLPFVAKAMVLARDAILVAGGKSGMEGGERAGPGMLWIVSRADGTGQGECELPAPPVLDGMAFTDSGIFISTTAGSVICLGGDQSGGKSGSGRPAGSKARLPEQVDLGPSLRSLGLEPRFQGDRPTCSVFVVVQALEYAAARKAGRGRELSVEYLNWASNRVNGDRKDGGFFSDLWKGFQVHGICAEKSMPYRSTLDRRARPSREARAEAREALSQGLRLHWIKEWDPNKGLTEAQLREVRATLARGWPVCGGFLWPKKQVWKDRLLQMCPRDAVRDGHSVLLVGYRDDPSLPGGGAFLIRNSSGKLREGLLTYEYVKAYMNDAAWIAPEEQERQATRK